MEAKEKIENFINEFAEEILSEKDQKVEQIKNDKYKLVYQVLLGNEIAIANKIKYFLKKHAMLDDRTDNLVKKLVKVRNSIAHGRVIYKEMFIWPLSPFFSSIEDIDNVLDKISILAGRAIAVHLGLVAWKEEWDNLHMNLFPSDQVISNFINNSNGFMTTDKLIDSINNNITISSIVNYYLRNPKKYDLSQLENQITCVIEEVDVIEENSHELFLVCILLADSPNENISQKSIEKVKKIYFNNWYDFSNIKDALYYLNYCKFDVQWFENWIKSMNI